VGEVLARHKTSENRDEDKGDEGSAIGEPAKHRCSRTRRTEDQEIPNAVALQHPEPDQVRRRRRGASRRSSLREAEELEKGEDEENTGIQVQTFKESPVITLANLKGNALDDVWETKKDESEGRR
jgi:hypothetical protein